MNKLSFVLAALLLAAPLHAQQPDLKAMQATQKSEMARFAYLDGVWRGTAYVVMPDGTRHDIVQTERIGPMLDGTLKVIEGRGYNPDGSIGFNAFAVLSYDNYKKSFNLKSHAMGNAGDFEFVPTADGYTWKIPAGPMTIVYTAKVKDGTFHEVGDRVGPDGTAVRFFEMTLRRVGDTQWPAGNPIPMK